MIRLDNVSKIFGTGVAGLSDITLLVDRGEFVFLVGHTGSGKTTLLRLLVRETLPTSGTVIVDDFDLIKLPANKIPHLRKKVGVVFQDLKLLMDRTTLENILLPIQVAGIKREDGVKRAEELLELVGLGSHKEKFPIQLSGGELQRVAIARALALSPEILLADEPTGNLDPQTALEIVQLLEKINETGTTIIMATHNMEIVEKLKKRVVGLDKGKMIKDEKQHGKGKGGSVKGEAKEEKGHKESLVIASKAPYQKSVQGEAKQSDSENEIAASQAPRNDEKNNSLEAQDNKEEKIEEHKKETKKLSDLLAKARQTLHKKEDKKKDLPFGFEKEMDVKETT